MGGAGTERSKGDSDDNSNNLTNYPVLHANQAQPSRAYGTGKLANMALEVLVGSRLSAARVHPYLKPCQGLSYLFPHLSGSQGSTNEATLL